MMQLFSTYIKVQKLFAVNRRKVLVFVSKKTYPRRLRAIRIANAVNKVEGVPVTESAHRLSAQWARGEITGKAMKQALLEKHRQASHE